MTLRLLRLDPAGTDRDDLIAFLTSELFPFHVRPRPTRAQVEEAIAEGAYDDAEHATFWLVDDAGIRVGLVRLEDLEDPTPLFDLRLAEAHRGRGLGREALRALTEHVFRTMPEVRRFEGQTREDNLAMRRVFLHAGWVKEAHYREAWPVDGAEPVASVAYAILRRDGEAGTTTPVEWEDVTL